MQAFPQGLPGWGCCCPFSWSSVTSLSPWFPKIPVLVSFSEFPLIMGSLCSLPPARQEGKSLGGHSLFSILSQTPLRQEHTELSPGLNEGKEENTEEKNINLYLQSWLNHWVSTGSALCVTGQLSTGKVRGDPSGPVLGQQHSGLLPLVL